MARLAGRAGRVGVETAMGHRRVGGGAGLRLLVGGLGWHGDGEAKRADALPGLGCSLRKPMTLPA